MLCGTTAHEATLSSKSVLIRSRILINVVPFEDFVPEVQHSYHYLSSFRYKDCHQLSRTSYKQLYKEASKVKTTPLPTFPVYIISP